MSNRAIVFIGFMGAGKSSAVRSISNLVGTVDTDDWIERHVGMPVATYFDEFGEEPFREEEARLAVDLLNQVEEGGAVALGGGTILSEQVREALRHHTVVWLQVDPRTAWSRVERSDRPLARDRSKFDALFAERLRLYESLADVVIPQGNIGMVRNALPAIQALAEMPAGTKLLWAASGSAEYPILVGRGLLGGSWWPLESRRFCITDRRVGPRYASLLAPLEASVEVEPGEEAKSLAEMERILRELVAAGMRRDDHVVALGGGVVGDLGGFCAHVFQRGVPVIQVPTTFVAQVDSAYGGKTGVDLPEGKNYVGAYQHPAAVLADTSTLDSLPSWELESGFVEALKTGLLAGGALWERVRAVQRLDQGTIDHLVFACARFKCKVVAEDERDSGWRNILNLGHTIGHAIETATAYEHYSHGEAIGLGLLAALRLSDAPDLRDQIEATLDRFSLPTRMSAEYVDVEAILDAVQRDKKRTAAGVGFVLLSEPGEPRVGQLVEPDAVRAAVEELYA